MYNPFPLLSQGLLNDQVARGKRYFVRQTYPRGLAAGSGGASRTGMPGGGGNASAGGANTAGAAAGAQQLKAAFLLRAYFPEEKAIAEQHLSTLTGDTLAFLYDADDPGHLQKLQIAATQPAGYRVFYAAKKGVDWDPPEKYQEKMREYIRTYHPSWRTKPGGDKIHIGLFEEFGQLFLKFNFDEQEDTIPLEWIEK